MAPRKRLLGPAPGSDVFHAIADPTRRRLLDHLARGESHVNALAAPFRMSRPAVSQHLRILLDAGLVDARRHGRERHYRLRAARLREVYDWVRHYEKFWKEKLLALRDYLAREDQKEKQRVKSSEGETP
jgi:DNA-binding transcriptional ArsR family regulator